MKTIKLRIIGLCLAITLTFAGAYATKVYADDPQGTDPQNPPTAPKSPPSSQVDPTHCAGCYVLWLLGF